MRAYAAQIVCLPLLALAGVVVAGCDKEEPVRAYRAPKEVAVRVAAEQAPSRAPQAGALPTWTVPSRWKELPAQELQFAAFAVSPAVPDAVLTVVPLGTSGSAGTIAANVNRWEGQLGLPPTPEGQIDKLVQHLDLNGLHFDLVDLEGTSASRKRMLAAIVPAGGRTWFFKLTGPSDVVAAQKENFESFIRSVRFASGASEGPATAQAGSQVSTAAVGPNGASASPPAMPPRADSNRPFKWEALPPGWTEVSNVQPPRIAAFKVESGGRQADLVVTRFPGSAVGSFADNVNRWRGQLGLAPVADASSYGPNTVALGGQKWTVVDIAGQDQPSRPAERMLVGMITRGEADPQTWFFKLQGPSKLVSEQRPAFEKFLESVKFE